MKLTLALLLLICTNCIGQNSEWREIPASDSYLFMNSVVFNSEKTLRLDSKPITFFYDSTQVSEIDSIPVYGIEALLDNFILPFDSLKPYISDSDIAYFKYQIAHPNITKWDKHYLNKGVKVVHSFLLLSCAYYSIPLFSLDRKTVIYCECGPCYSTILHWNEVSGTWDWISVTRHGG